MKIQFKKLIKISAIFGIIPNGLLLSIQTIRMLIKTTLPYIAIKTIEQLQLGVIIFDIILAIAIVGIYLNKKGIVV